MRSLPHAVSSTNLTDLDLNRVPIMASESISQRARNHYKKVDSKKNSNNTERPRRQKTTNLRRKKDIQRPDPNVIRSAVQSRGFGSLWIAGDCAIFNSQSTGISCVFGSLSERFERSCHTVDRSVTFVVGNERKLQPITCVIELTARLVGRFVVWDYRGRLWTIG